MELGEPVPTVGVGVNVGSLVGTEPGAEAEEVKGLDVDGEVVDEGAAEEAVEVAGELEQAMVGMFGGSGNLLT